MSLTFPARFTLAAAMNPCPCGYFNDRRVTATARRDDPAHISKISGPLLDRIDIDIDVPAVNYKELRSGAAPEARLRFASAWCGPRGAAHRFAVTKRGFTPTRRWVPANPRLLRAEHRLRAPAGAGHGAAGLERPRPDRILKVARTVPISTRRQHRNQAHRRSYQTVRWTARSGHKTNKTSNR